MTGPTPALAVLHAEAHHWNWFWNQTLHANLLIRSEVILMRRLGIPRNTIQKDSLFYLLG